MLIQRIITASIIAPLAVWAVIALPDDYFALVWGIFILSAAWEWMNLSGFSNLPLRLLFLLALIVPMIGIHYWTVVLEIIAETFNWPEVKKFSGIVEWLVVPAVLWWFFVMVLIRNAAGALLQRKTGRLVKALLGWYLLLVAWMFFARLRTLYPMEMVVYFLFLIWGADIAAYFTGKKFGVTKLAPDISPGKTVEGMYGALATAFVFAVIFTVVFEFSFIYASDMVLLSVLTVLISIYGDLFVSLLKRQRGLKDSGSLLPGHGGVLDRLDSVIAGIPVFYAGIYLLYYMMYGA